MALVTVSLVLAVLLFTHGCTSRQFNTSFSFSATPALDLQPYFLDQPAGPYIGGDIGTSLAVPTPTSPQRVLWLFGDTLTGSTRANGSRIIDAMPRNSVGLINVSAAGKVMGPMAHFVRSDPHQPQHAGFFTPPANFPDQWYWPTVACYVQDTIFVFALRMGPHPDPLFPFETIAVDVLALGNTNDNNALNWNVERSASIPHVNNSFVLSSAASAPDEGYVYLLGTGAAGAAILSRLTAADLVQLNLNNMEFLVASQAWVPFSPALAPAALFANGPSEATLQFHPYLQQWLVVIVNTFQSSSVALRLAPSVTGPWTIATPVYPIPSAFLQGAFCYAGKAHPELVATAAEIILTYMCNTPSLAGLVDRPDLYVPRVVRVTISAAP